VVVQRIHSRGRGWATIHLRESDAALPVSSVDAELTSYVPGAHLFFPAVLEGFIDHRSPLALYIFASPPDEDLRRVERCGLVAGVLRVPGGRGVEVTPDTELQALMVRNPVQTVRPGQRATVLSGDFAGLAGEVVRVSGRYVRMRVDLHSMSRELVIPRGEVRYGEAHKAVLA
jgi:hypothetical protein